MALKYNQLVEVLPRLTLVANIPPLILIHPRRSRTSKMRILGDDLGQYSSLHTTAKKTVPRMVSLLSIFCTLGNVDVI